MGVLAVEMVCLMKWTLDGEHAMFMLTIVVHKFGPDLVKKEKDILSSPSSPKPLPMVRALSQSPDNIPGKHPTEKHKTYHIKDEQLLKDGFKKFMKPDPCGFPGCRFSQTCNHIHCVRENCNYVLHSRETFFLHKRKHERKDSEIAYRKFKLAQQAVNMATLSGEPGMPSDLSTSPGSSLHLLQQATSLAAFNALHDKFDTYSNSSSEGGRGSPPSKYLSEPPTPSGYGTPGFHFKFSPGASLPQTPTPSGYFTDHSSSAADIDDFIELTPISFLLKPLGVYIEELCTSLYDIVRPLVIHMQHLETLSELCTVLRHEVQEQIQMNLVKASGTFYPLSGLSSTSSSSHIYSEDNIKQEPSEPLPGEVSEKSLQLLPEWMSLDRHERYGPELSCSRPFCKLKRKEHYHCNACNQAFSELDRLKPHITKHNPGAIPSLNLKSEHNNNDENQETRIPSGLSILPIPPLDGPELVPPSQYPPGFSAAMAAMANQQLALMTSQGLPFMPHMPALYSSPTGLMFGPPPGFNPHASLMGNGLLESAARNLLPPVDHKEALRRSLTPTRESLETKKSRAQSSMRMLKDEPVPEGYTRYRFNEDCQYTQCGYREHQTHFHCMRTACGYSFCDKTRFVQHTARHERLDTLMGGDFLQYRANVSCGREDCVYNNTITTTQNKASHFHCLKCDFVCTDTNKVVAHRRQHQKLDSIMAAGFEKFTPSQSCTQSDCIHSGKQTHYHCLNCQYAVVGLSQMTAHKYRHMDEQEHQRQQ
ncbi:zinc finger protein castor homolog 1-like [Diaphorina citri]|uniref:Zinc finger protein castor homolog 1-like n=1 Tax=Diaphorina citri TaxID=121845 RepID=A0A3Q0JAU4_DIACI|nr:zinc finger protein castor homolog 1-like [Diaphorina citri]